MPVPRPRAATRVRSACLGAALLAALLGPGRAEAHGAAPVLVPLDAALAELGAAARWDDYAGLFTLTRNGTEVRVRPGARTVMVNGAPLLIEAPLVLRQGKPWVTADFVRRVFQSALDRTFVVETVPNPLNPLSAAEIASTVEILTAAGRLQPGHRFTEIAVQPPPKDQVWRFALTGEPVTAPRSAQFVILDGRQVIEGSVDLTARRVTAWTPVPGAHGMVMVEDFETVQAAIEASPDYAAALAKRGIRDPKQVVATPLTVGFFDGKDGLRQEDRLLKVVSYLDVGDGNYWAHPIENLVAVVDLERRAVVRIEDAGVIPVPQTPRPYDGRDRAPGPARKPLEIREPEGKSYEIAGHTLRWRNWRFHVRLDPRAGLILSTVTYEHDGRLRKVLYEGSLGGMVVPYGDPDVGWYFKAYLDAGEYGMGMLTSPIARGLDAPENCVLLDATLADNLGRPQTLPGAIAVFERHAGPELKHHEMGRPNHSVERRELVVRWISTVGNYDYIFDWVFAENGTIGIDAGASGIEAVKAVRSRTMQDPTAAEDTRHGTLIDHHIVGTTHQHIYNFRLDLDIDGEANALVEVDPVVVPNGRGGPRTSAMETVTRTVASERAAAQRFDPSTIRLLSNPGRTNKVGNPVAYQLIPYAGGTHPIAKGANFGRDEWIHNRLSFMDRQLWVTRYRPDERHPEGRYPNRSREDTGLGRFVADDEPIVNADTVVWLTTGTTHVARAEEWPVMPTEWVHVLLKPWNFFDETPTLGLGAAPQ